jgi:two-component system nitrate/nitrite response regulator NarP
MISRESRTVAIYTDQLFLADGVRQALQAIQGFSLVASFTTPSDLILFLESGHADVVLLDLTESLTVSNIQDIANAGKRPRVLLWAADLSVDLAFQVLQAGVKGIVRKSSRPQSFIAAIEAVGGGDLWFDEELVRNVLSGRRVALTPREGQLVQLISCGLRNKEIAWTLGITEGTVKVYLSRLYEKLGVADRFELALYGLKNMHNGSMALGSRSESTNVQTLVDPAPIRYLLERPSHSEPGGARSEARTAIALDARPVRPRALR